MQVDRRLVSIFERVLQANANDVTLESSVGSLPNWNSRNYVAVIMEVEAEFGVELSTLEAARMQSVRGIYDVLAEKGVDLQE